LWLALITRLDISHATAMMAKNVSNDDPQVWTSYGRCLRYLSSHNTLARGDLSGSELIALCDGCKRGMAIINILEQLGVDVRQYLPLPMLVDNEAAITLATRACFQKEYEIPGTGTTPSASGKAHAGPAQVPPSLHRRNGGGLVGWGSRKQSAVAFSTAEAERIALQAGMQRAVPYLRDA
jgi:hypothetical protein